MGKNFTYVDNSNVYIEGARVSAVINRLPGAATIIDAMNNNVVDRKWQLDYGRLHDFVCGNNPALIGAANLWGSPPPGDSFWKMVESYKFKVTTYLRSPAGEEKKVDVAIAHRITKDAYAGVIDKAQDEITLVAGDKDFVPVVADLVAEGFKVDVVFWNQAAQEIKAAATRFIDLNPHLGLLTL
jgi:hypothetical protein